METRYSNLPPVPFDTASNPLSKGQEVEDATLESDGRNMAHQVSFRTKIATLMPLFTYGILSVGVTIFILIYVDGRQFNVTERTPLVQLLEGPSSTPFLPIQSDIVTALSGMIAVQKYALAAWVASLCWYIALFLMERPGLTLRHLKVLLGYELLAPSLYLRDWTFLIIGSLLLASLAANLSSPILTGSISWVPSSRLVQGLSTGPIQFDSVEYGGLTRIPTMYYDFYHIREGYVMSGVGSATIGWGRNSDKTSLKRASGLVQTLPINSTIENVTLPYFQIHSVRWIERREEIPGIKDGASPTDILHPHFQMTPTTVSGFPVGYAILVPNITANWSTDPLDSAIVRDTRLLILYYAWNRTSSGGHVALTQDLPPSAYRLPWETYYYAFAWVSFSAGVGRCKEYNCVVSSPSTIRNNTPVELEPHRLTFQALSMAPVVGVWLVNQNASLPYLWSDINDYVEAVLVRSYSGAWSTLNSGFQTSVAIARYIPSIPSLLADVNHPRVYTWFGIQILVTLSSVLFLIIRSNLSRYSQLEDTTLTAFYLNTMEIPSEENKIQLRDGLLKIESGGDRLKVKLE